MTADASSPMSERMQALLSRAVEDQLSEQRQLAGAISDFRRQIGKLAQELETLKADPPDPSELLESGLDAVSADVREAVRLLGERIDKVSRLVQERARELSELRSVVADVQTATGQHAQALAGVAGGLAALPSFGNRIGALQDGLSAVHDRLHGLEELGGTVAQVNHRVDAVDASVRELLGALAGVAARVGDVPSRSDVDGMLRGALEPFAGIADRLAGVEASGPALKERLDRLGEGLEEQSGVLERLGTRLDEVAQAAATRDTQTPDRVARLEEATTALRSRIEDATTALRSRVEQLHANPVRDPRVDDVAATVGEVHDGLFGEDGIEAQVAALSAAPRQDPDLDARIAKTVERVVGEMEQRLSEHVDEAVLALAEALLRRKGARPGVTPSPFEEMAAAESSGFESIGPAIAEREPVSEPYPHPETLGGAQHEFGHGLVEEPEHYDDEDEGPQVEDTDATAAYQVGFGARANGSAGRHWEPNGAAPERVDAAAVAGPGVDEADTSPRRRPWWRPTD